MKSLFARFSKLLLVLSLCMLMLPVPLLVTTDNAHAFGSLSENGTAAFMGIGVNPTKILHVSGTGPGTVPLFVRGTDSAGFIIERTPTNRWVLGVNESPALGNGFVLSTIPTGNTSVPRLMITQDGKVGIGKTSPTSKLDVFTASGIGVYGQSNSDDGVFGESNDSAGVYGLSDTGNGMHGQSATTGYGVYGESSQNAGVAGKSSSTAGVAGFFGSGSQTHTAGVGVYGKHEASGNYGYIGGSSRGVYGTSENGTGVYGYSVQSDGIYGMSVNGDGITGVAQGSSGSGVYGSNPNSSNGFGVEGYAGSGGIGVFGHAIGGYGVFGSSNNYAGYLEGRAVVTDNLSIGKTVGANSKLQVAGALATAINTIENTFDYPLAKILTANDSVIAAAATGDNWTIILPPLTGIDGRVYTVKKTDSSAHAVIVDGFAIETIDGAQTYELLNQWKYVVVVASANGWLIVGGN